MKYLLIVACGGLGSLARYLLGLSITERYGARFPWGTLTINVLGSFVIGFFAALTGPDGRFFIGTTARQFVTVGICGGYTTFSSFSLQTLNLANDGEWFPAVANISLSVLLCLLAVALGYAIANSINSMNWM